MFLYLIAFAAALLTFFGLTSTRNFFCNFFARGRFLSIFRLFSSRNEFAACQDREECSEKTDDTPAELAEGHTEIMHENLTAIEDKSVLQNKESNDSLAFDCRTKRYDFQREAEDKDNNNILVPQDMWNILKKTAVPASERRNAESLFEALLQETLRESRTENEAFNKTQIIDEATFEKMLESQSENKISNIK